MGRRSIPISFRIDQDLAQQIDELREPFNVSRGEWVRGVVVGRLYNEGQDAIAARLDRALGVLDDIESRLERLPRTHARLLYQVLLHVASLDKEEAQRIAASLLKEGP